VSPGISFFRGRPGLRLPVMEVDVPHSEDLTGTLFDDGFRQFWLI